VEAPLACVSVTISDVTGICEGPTKPVELFGFAKIVAFLFVEFLNLNVPARSVDDTRLALLLPSLDFSMDGLPVQGCAVLLQPPFLKLSFILPFAISCFNMQCSRKQPQVHTF
jgi:hypothetical protein